MSAASLAPFRTRDFAILWSGLFVSNSGTFMASVALAYHVADTTGKASWLAVISVATFLPSAIVGPIGSAMADRLDRARLLTTTNLLQAVLAMFLAVKIAAGGAGPELISVVALAMGCAHAFGNPSTQTILPLVVPRAQLVHAVALSNGQYTLGRMVGPIAAAIAIQLGGISAAMWGNAVSFVLATIAVRVITIPHREPDRRPVFGALAQGIRFARTDPSMRRMLPYLVLGMAVGAPFMHFVSQMGTNVFDGDSTTTSILVTCQGFGGAAAAFGMGALTSRWSLWRLMAGTVVLQAAALVVYGLAPTLWLSCIGLAAAGFGHGCAFTTWMGTAHAAAPDNMRGRVIGTNTFLIGILVPIGSMIQGTIADIVGLRAVTVGSAVALMVGLALLLRFGPTKTSLVRRPPPAERVEVAAQVPAPN